MREPATLESSGESSGSERSARLKVAELLSAMHERIERDQPIDELIAQTGDLGDVATGPILEFLDEVVNGPELASDAIETRAEALYRAAGVPELRSYHGVRDPSERENIRQHNARCFRARREMDDVARERFARLCSDLGHADRSKLTERLERVHQLHGMLVSTPQPSPEMLLELDRLTIEDVVYLRERNEEMFGKNGAFAKIARRWAQLLPTIASDQEPAIDKLSELLLEGGPYTGSLEEALTSALSEMSHPKAKAVLALARERGMFSSIS